MGSTTIQPTDLVWVDLETTGLDRDGDEILEVGVIITDRFGNIKDTKAWVVAQRNEDWAEDMDDTVRAMHQKSGLIEAVDDADLFIGDVEDDVCAWLREHGLHPDMKMVLAGSTVGFDRGFLDEHTPAIIDMFGHRSVDVSSIKEICKRVNPMIADAWAERAAASEKPHRSIADLHMSIQEYRFYLDNFLFVPGTEEA